MSRTSDPGRHLPRHPECRSAAPVALVGLLLAASICYIGCGAAGDTPFGDAFQRTLGSIDRDRVCGPGDIAPLIPDCPVEGVCFTTGCNAHDHCYRQCGVDKAACDRQLHRDLIRICDRELTALHEDYSVCTYMAYLFWVAVDRLGQSSFDETQEIHGCNLIDPLVRDGACCLPGAPPVCEDRDETTKCQFDAVFVPGLSCAEVSATLGGCPVPPNDECADRIRVCPDQTANDDLGRCVGESDFVPGERLCSVTSQDCYTGEPCIPLEHDAYRCRAYGDNRLASTDGPEAGGDCEPSGVDSFQADIWYEYVAPCSGVLTVRMCEGTFHDTMLSVHGGHDPAAGCSCPDDNSDLLVCDDDSCGGFSAASVASVERVVEGACYTIRVGGWSNDGTIPGTARGKVEFDVLMVCHADR